jgi:membrane-bound ClpP family serine protease
MANQTGGCICFKYLFGPKGVIVLVDMLALVGQLFLTCTLSCIAIIIAFGLYIAGLMIHIFALLFMALFIPGVTILHGQRQRQVQVQGSPEERGSSVQSTLMNFSERMFSWATSLFAGGIASIVSIFHPRRDDFFQ